MDQGRAVEYALRSGLISPGDVVSGNLRLETREHRNLSFVLSADDASYFIKQSRVLRSDALGAEAFAYRILAAASEEFVARFLPQLLRFDEELRLLVFEHIDDASNVGDIVRGGVRLPDQVANSLGIALAELHALPVLDEFGDCGRAETFPLALRLTAPPVEILYTESPGSLELIRMIQGDPRLTELINELREQWTLDAVIHNDVRLENIVTSNSNGLIRIVDWELYGPGWSVWDLASLFGSCIALWITTPSAGAGVHSPSHALPTLQSIISGVWDAYRANTIETDRPDPVLLVRLTGVRLLQSALEFSSGAVRPSKESAQLLEITRMFAKRPHEAWVHVLGLPLVDDATAALGLSSQ